MRCRRRRKTFERLLFASLTALAACESTSTDPHCPDKTVPPLQPEKVTIQEGSWGQLSFWSGNFMPSTKCTSGTVVPVQRTVLFFEATPESSTTPSVRGLFREVKTELVDSIISDSTGFFEIPLPPGTYSLFVREDSLLWANLFRDGLVNPIEVQEGQATSVEVRINYLMVI